MTIISTELKYANAVNSLRPGCQFIAEASGITRWDSPDLEQPSESDIQDEIKKLEVSGVVLEEIAKLEATITPRRLRDAIANDAGKSWVAAVEALIDTERGKL
jgi:hypothetical protein